MRKRLLCVCVCVSADVPVEAVANPGNNTWTPAAIAGLSLSAVFHFTLYQGDETTLDTGAAFNSGALYVTGRSRIRRRHIR